MAERHDSMVTPQIEVLLRRTDSKFRLVTLASQRARQINAYFGHLGEGLGSMVPPQVTSLARKPLSIAFEEIAAEKIIGVPAAEQPGAHGIPAVPSANPEVDAAMAEVAEEPSAVSVEDDV
jgi:DNA-directed RNA polymerase subunit omega